MSKTMVSARISESLNEELEAMAVSTRRSKSYLFTRALEDFVEQKARLYREIDEAVKEADASGEWISEERMNAWLDSWGKPDQLPPPEPDIFKKPK